MENISNGIVIAAALVLLGNFLGVLQKIHALTKELRWKKAVNAQKRIDDTWANAFAHDALTMLDWDGRRYTVAGKLSQPITFAYRNQALRTIGGGPFHIDEVHVRDCFDELFNQMSFTQNAINTGAVLREDVAGWWLYYVKRLASCKGVVRPFLNAYDYPLALQFLEHFQEWPR